MILELGFAAESAAMQLDATSALSVAQAHWRADISRRLNRAHLREDEITLLETLRDGCGSARLHDPFFALFKLVADAAETLHEGGWPPVSFEVRRLASPLTGPRALYSLGATTEFSVAGSEVSVVLKIHPPALGPEAYLAIPSILVHECVCHVPARDGGPIDNGSPFAEGFMDYAATYYRRLWAARFGAIGNAIDAHGDRYFAAVAATSPEFAVARGAGIRAGHELAHRLHRGFGLVPGRASQAVAGLAIALNHTAAPLYLKDRFVTRIARAADGHLDDLVMAALQGLCDPAELL